MIELEVEKAPLLSIFYTETLGQMVITYSQTTLILVPSPSCLRFTILATEFAIDRTIYLLILCNSGIYGTGLYHNLTGLYAYVSGDNASCSYSAVLVANFWHTFILGKLICFCFVVLQFELVCEVC